MLPPLLRAFTIGQILAGDGLNVDDLDIIKITEACQETKMQFICREM